MRMIHTTGTSRTNSHSNIVDLAEYRQTLTMSEPPAPAVSYPLIWEEDPAPQSCKARPHRSLWLLDIFASIGVLAMTLAFTLEILSF